MQLCGSELRPNGFVVDEGVDAPSQIVPLAESKEPDDRLRMLISIVSLSASSQFGPLQRKGAGGPSTTVTSSS